MWKTIAVDDDDRSSYMHTRTLFTHCEFQFVAHSVLSSIMPDRYACIVGLVWIWTIQKVKAIMYHACWISMNAAEMVANFVVKFFETIETIGIRKVLVYLVFFCLCIPFAQTIQKVSRDCFLSGFCCEGTLFFCARSFCFSNVSCALRINGINFYFFFSNFE